MCARACIQLSQPSLAPLLHKGGKGGQGCGRCQLSASWRGSACTSSCDRAAAAWNWCFCCVPGSLACIEVQGLLEQQRVRPAVRNGVVLSANEDMKAVLKCAGKNACCMLFSWKPPHSSHICTSRPFPPPPARVFFQPRSALCRAEPLRVPTGANVRTLERPVAQIPQLEAKHKQAQRPASKRAKRRRRPPQRKPAAASLRRKLWRRPGRTGPRGRRGRGIGVAKCPSHPESAAQAPSSLGTSGTGDNSESVQKAQSSQLRQNMFSQCTRHTRHYPTSSSCSGDNVCGSLPDLSIHQARRLHFFHVCFT